MNQLLPHRFLFRYSFAVRRVKQLPRRGKNLLKLPAVCALPDFGELDAQAAFADVRLGWNGGGMGISAEVRGKQRPLECRLGDPAESDGMQVWIDTRNTRNIHRASRFCHHFCLLPAGAGKNADRPCALQWPIARAREEAPETHAAEIRVGVEITPAGYLLEAWIPAVALHGFDPESTRELGFYYLLQDAELGQQFLSVGPDFPIAHDPSLWATIELEQ